MSLEHLQQQSVLGVPDRHATVAGAAAKDRPRAVQARCQAMYGVGRVAIKGLDQLRLSSKVNSGQNPPISRNLKKINCFDRNDRSETADKCQQFHGARTALG